jgi:hypothetical protein
LISDVAEENSIFLLELKLNNFKPRKLESKKIEGVFTKP